MSYLDKTFCASPNCKNDCGRRMTDPQRQGLYFHNDKQVSYGYFCGLPFDVPSEHDSLCRLIHIDIEMLESVEED